MLDRLSTLIPDDSRRQVALDLPTRDFEMAYRLDCRNLCADFCEDIEFRFSLGLASLIRRFMGKTGMQRFAHGYTQVGRLLLLAELLFSSDCSCSLSHRLHFVR